MELTNYSFLPGWKARVDLPSILMREWLVGLMNDCITSRENQGNISLYGAFEVNYGRVNTEYTYYYVISILSMMG